MTVENDKLERWLLDLSEIQIRLQQTLLAADALDWGQRERNRVDECLARVIDLKKGIIDTLGVLIV